MRYNYFLYGFILCFFIQQLFAQIYTDPNKYRHYIDIDVPSDCRKYNIEHAGQRYTKMQNFSEGLILIKINSTGEWAYMDSRAYIIIPPQYYTNFGWFGAGLAHIKHKGKWGYINPSMEVVIPCIFDEAAPFSKFKEIAKVCKNGQYFYINRKGQRVHGAG